MANYKVYWSKRYYASGTVEIEAYSFIEAEEIVLENIGNYEGSMQYDPDGDEVEAYKWTEEVGFNDTLSAMPYKDLRKLQDILERKDNNV